MYQLVIVIIITLVLVGKVGAAEGMVNIKSEYNVEQSTSRMIEILDSKGMTIFAHINHSVAAKKVGMTLGDTELIIFGNPKVGSPLMKCQQSVGIDLPQKVLVWEDEAGVVWISYNDPMYLKERHQVVGCDAVFEKVTNALASIAKQTASD